MLTQIIWQELVQGYLALKSNQNGKGVNHKTIHVQKKDKSDVGKDVNIFTYIIYMEEEKDEDTDRVSVCVYYDRMNIKQESFVYMFEKDMEQ